MRQWTKKFLLPGTIIVTDCKCPSLCHADNHPFAAGNHGSVWRRVLGGQRAIGLPSTSSSAYTRPVRGLVPSWCSSVTGVTHSLWSTPAPLHSPSVGGTCRPNLRAASEWQSSAQLEATQRGQVITAMPFKESSSQRRCLSPPHHPWHRVPSHACWAFYQHFTAPWGAEGSLGEARLLLSSNPALRLLIHVYSQRWLH